MAEMQTAYDAIPYHSNPFRQTHPERLSAIARLFGLDSPDPARCRVLELGCATAGNLIAMAQVHPESRYVGLDASSRQIAEGWKMVEQLGLKNVQLKHMDILDVGQDLGQFDYIVSHGVFSWVPPRVQDKMLEICQRQLAPNGVAYISYNTYPGWHIRGIVRDMMFYRGMQFADPATQLAQAKSLVEFVAQASGRSDTPYQKLLQGELSHLSQQEDYYLHHEHLEEHNQPLYFHQFARKLAVNGLQYLGDADFATMVSTNFSPKVAATLQQLGAHDIVQMEQYMDFVRCRYFRKTLLCRNSVKLNRALAPGVVKGLLLAADATPVPAEAPLDAAQAVTYQNAGGYKLTCRSPLTKTALRILKREWPMPMAFGDLCGEAISAATSAGHAPHEPDPQEFLASEILTGMAAGLVEWRLQPPPYTTIIAKRPLATGLARLQASQGYKVTSLRGDSVNLDEIHRQTLTHLDGTRDRAQIAEILLAALKRKEMVLHREGDKSPVTEPAEMQQLLESALEKVLANFARMALLAKPLAAPSEAKVTA